MGASGSLPVIRFLFRLKSNCCVSGDVKQEGEVDETDAQCQKEHSTDDCNSPV